MNDTTIETASADLETMSAEIREMVSTEFPELSWELQEEDKGGFDTSVCKNPGNDPKADPSKYDSTAYSADMWYLPTEVDADVGQRLIDGFLRIAERHGYSTGNQHREGNEDGPGETTRAILDVGGPHPGSNVGFAFEKAIVISGRIGCLPREMPPADASGAEATGTP